MKKYIFMAVAGMLALSSCSSDDNEQTAQKAPRQMTFTAGFGGAQTRASISGFNVTFDAPDYISILSANNTNKQFTTTSGNAGNSNELASFTGMAADDTKFYAIYPYGSYSLSGEVLSGVVIPFEQNGAASDGWDKNAAIAYATTTDENLTFRNACALLKVTNGMGDGVQISVGTVHGGPMTGTYSLNTSDGTLTYASDGKAAAEVNAVPNGKTIYIAIAPGEYPDFNAFCGTVAPNTKIKSRTTAITFEAGKIYDLGNTGSWLTE